MLTIWLAYYALAEHLNESPQPDREILLSPLHTYTLIHKCAHTSINMQAHGFIDANTHTHTDSCKCTHTSYDTHVVCIQTKSLMHGFFFFYTLTHSYTHTMKTVKALY